MKTCLLTMVLAAFLSVSCAVHSKPDYLEGIAPGMSFDEVSRTHPGIFRYPSGASGAVVSLVTTIPALGDWVDLEVELSDRKVTAIHASRICRKDAWAVTQTKLTQNYGTPRKTEELPGIAYLMWGTSSYASPCAGPCVVVSHVSLEDADWMEIRLEKGRFAQPKGSAERGRPLNFVVEFDPAADGDRRGRAVRALLARLNALPGVQQAGGASFAIRKAKSMDLYGDATFEGRTSHEQISYVDATPGYFAATRTPLLRGRLFVESEGPGAGPEGIIGADFARRYFPGEDPIGRRLRFQDGPWITIVGVTGDSESGRPSSLLFVSGLPLAGDAYRLTVSSIMNTATLLKVVHRAVADSGPDLRLRLSGPLQ